MSAKKTLCIFLVFFAAGFVPVRRAGASDSLSALNANAPLRKAVCALSGIEDCEITSAVISGIKNGISIGAISANADLSAANISDMVSRGLLGDGFALSSLSGLSALSSMGFKGVSLSGESQLFNAAQSGVSFAELGGFSGLQTLDISRCGIEGVCPLSAPSLLSLNASKNGITAFSSLPATLKKLYLSSNPVSQSGFLAQLTGLQTLDISSTGISDFSTLSGLSSLSALYVSGTAFDDGDLSSISGLASLRTLEAAGCRLTSTLAVSKARASGRFAALDTLNVEKNYIAFDVFGGPSPSSISGVMLSTNSLSQYRVFLLKGSEPVSGVTISAEEELKFARALFSKDGKTHGAYESVRAAACSAPSCLKAKAEGSTVELVPVCRGSGTLSSGAVSGAEDSTFCSAQITAEVLPGPASAMLRIYAGGDYAEYTYSGLYEGVKASVALPSPSEIKSLFNANGADLSAYVIPTGDIEITAGETAVIYLKAAGSSPTESTRPAETAPPVSTPTPSPSAAPASSSVLRPAPPVIVISDPAEPSSGRVFFAKYAGLSVLRIGRIYSFKNVALYLSSPKCLARTGLYTFLAYRLGRCEILTISQNGSYAAKELRVASAVSLKIHDKYLINRTD